MVQAKKGKGVRERAHKHQSVPARESRISGEEA